MTKRMPKKGKRVLAGSLLSKDTVMLSAPARPLPAASMTKAQAKRELKILFPESRLLTFQRKYRGACCPVAFGLWHKPCENHMAEYLHSRVRTTAWRSIHALLEPIRSEVFGYDPTLLSDYVAGIAPLDLRKRVNAVLAYRPHGLLYVQLNKVLDAITEAENAKFVPVGAIHLPAEELRWLTNEVDLGHVQFEDEAAQDRDFKSDEGGVRVEKTRGETFDRDRPLHSTKSTPDRDETGGEVADSDRFDDESCP